jgi:hypothetical protein
MGKDGNMHFSKIKNDKQLNIISLRIQITST